MGAKKDGQGKNDKTEVEVSEEQLALYEDTLNLLRERVDEITSTGVPIREFALALTKLEEAEMWIDRGFMLLGIEPALDDEEEEGDEEETPEGDEEE